MSMLLLVLSFPKRNSQLMQGMRKAAWVAFGNFGGTFREQNLLLVHGSFLTTVTPEDCGEYTQINEDKWGYLKQ